jgi:hypothetical protein
MPEHRCLAYADQSGADCVRQGDSIGAFRDDGGCGAGEIWKNS